MRTWSHLMAVGVLAGLAFGGQARTQTPELRKVHILMVFDTNAKELEKSLQIDKRRMRLLWQETIPEQRREITVLERENATKAKILDYYEKLTVGKNEGLVFYYAGHGATDKDNNKHCFDLRKGERLYRDDLKKAMKSKKAELVLLLTDCCSTPQEFKDDEDATLKRAFEKAKTTDRVKPTVRCLVFQARGVVDVTAATDNASWSDNLEGGIFTRSISYMLRAPRDVLDGNKDEFVTWREFYPQLKKETQSKFGQWRTEMVARGEKVEDRKQVPHAFELGNNYAAIGIVNQTKQAVEYTWRWPGEEEWTKARLAPGEKKAHVLQVKETSGPLPKLEAQFPFKTEPVKLATFEHTGAKEPTTLPERQYRRITSRPKN